MHQQRVCEASERLALFYRGGLPRPESRADHRIAQAPGEGGGGNACGEELAVPTGGQGGRGGGSGGSAGRATGGGDRSKGYFHRGQGGEDLRGGIRQAENQVWLFEEPAAGNGGDSGAG